MKKKKKCMHKKGQVDIGLGVIIMVALSIIVGVIFLQATAQSVGDSTNTVVINKTITAPAVNGIYNFTDYQALKGVTIYNATNGKLISSGNYTITNYQILNGGLVTVLNVTASDNAGRVWFVGASDAEPLGYITDSGGRALANLIVIMFALAILVVAIVPVLRNGFMDMIGK